MGLMEVAFSATWIGDDLDDLTATQDGTAAVPGLSAIEDPDASPRPGFISGTVEGHSGAGRILVAVNDVVVTASPALDGDGALAFRAMLPPGLSSLDDIDIRLMWVPKRIGQDLTGAVELEVKR
jgi:hypothetical protein